MSKKKYVIVYDYNFEGGTQATEFTFELPIRREQVIDPKRGPSGLIIQILKYYLGLGSITEVNSTFDIVTETALRRWQQNHRDEIYEKAGWTIEGFENPLGGARLGDLRIDAPGEFITEQGQFGEPTYLVMLDNGFMQAAKQLLESPEFQKVAETELNMAHRAFETTGEKQEPPKIVGRFVEYAYVTKVRRPQGTQTDDSHIKSQLGGLFREAVLNVFDFYGKDTTWVVDGAPRTEGLDALYELIGDDGDYERKQYEKIVQYQNRSDRFRQNQRFTFTVDRMDLNEQLNGEKIDVLFGQDLTPGATPIFASVTEIMYPTFRPSSTYSIKISIRRDLFDLIRGGKRGRLGGTVNLADPATYEAIGNALDEAEDGFNKAKDFIVNDLKKPFTSDFLRDGAGRFKDSVDKWAKGQKRKLEQAGKNALKNAWADATSGRGGFFGGPGNDAWAASQAADMASKRMQLALSNPVRVTYKLSNFVPNILAVSEKIRAFAPDIKEFRLKNKPRVEKASPFKKPKDAITPYFNPESEADRLAAVQVALGGFMAANGYSILVSPLSSDKIEIFFAPVRKNIPASIPENEDLSPNLDERPKQGPTFGTIVGYRIIKINYLHSSGEVEELTTGIPSFNSEEPFTSPTIMGYLVSLDEMASEVATVNPCVELISSPAVEFFAKYHWPIISFSFNQKTEPLVDLKINFDPGSLLTAAQEFEEAAKLLEGNVNSLMESTFFEQKGGSIVTADLVPDFGKIPCDIEEMWNQFLNRWNMSYILCDFLKCVPMIGPWNFEFNWKLPKLPKMPSFDPLQFIIPQIKILIADMIMAFLCALIKMILDSIRLPDCADLLKFGAMALSEINKKNEDNPFANAEEKASLYEKTADTLKNMGLPPSVLNSESEDSVATLLDKISLVLTPYELCSLLEGQASEEVLVVVLNVIQATSSSLASVLSTREDVFMFFQTLGQVVDPNMCARIKELDDIIVANDLCPPEDGSTGGFSNGQGGERDIRRLLDDVGASPEEIAAELKKAAERRDIMKDLARTGDLSGLIPGTNYNDLKDAGLPGPYNNPMHDRLVKMSVETLVDNIKSYFDVEMAAFPNLLMSRSTKLVQPGEPRFNALDYTMYVFYLKQVDNLQQDPPLTARKVHKLKPCNVEYLDENDNQIDADPSTLAEANDFFDEMGIPENDRQHMRFYVTKAEDKEEDAEGNEFYPDVLIPSNEDEGELQFEKVQEFGELIEQYVIGYVQKYQIQDPDIMAKLKSIVKLDQTTITRKFPGSAENVRELHVRLMTEPVRGEPTRIESTSNVPARYSVGYSELPFKRGFKAKDCYRFTYSNIPSVFRSNRSYFSRVYSEDLKPEYQQFRKDSLDVKSTIHQHKLLRPGGFAEILVEKYRSLGDESSQNNSFNDYRDHGLPTNTNIRPAIQGYIANPDQTLVDNAFGQFRTINSLEAINSKVLTGELAEQLLESRLSNNPLYSSVSDSINFSISQIIKQSKYFNYDELLQLKDDLTRLYFVSDVDGVPCYILNKKAIDFEKMVQEFLQGYKTEVAKIKHDPVDRDFNVNGPYEDAMISGLFKVYVTMAGLEIMLKGIFMFSSFGAERMFDQRFVMDYLVDTISNDFKNALVERKIRNQIFSILKRITNIDNNDEALESMVLRNLDMKKMVDFVDRVFENDSSSYKEKFYNDLAKNAKHIPSATNYPKVVVQKRREGLLTESLRGVFEDYGNLPRGRSTEDDRNFGNFLYGAGDAAEVPASLMLPNLRDKFRFEGFDEDTINKKINSGHFWIEKFYRIGNFEQFSSIYNEVKNYTESSILQQYTYRKIPSLGTTGANYYSEYLSSEDLINLLYGQPNRASDEELVDSAIASADRNFAEYEFIEHVFISLLMQYFAAIETTGLVDSLKQPEPEVGLGIPPAVVPPPEPTKTVPHKESMWQSEYDNLNLLRDENCLAYQIMYDLGMAARYEGSSQEKLVMTGHGSPGRLKTGATNVVLEPVASTSSDPEAPVHARRQMSFTSVRATRLTTNASSWQRSWLGRGMRDTHSRVYEETVLDINGNVFAEAGDISPSPYDIPREMSERAGSNFTEFDSFYRTGVVTKEELYDRAYRRVQPAHATYFAYKNRYYNPSDPETSDWESQLPEFERSTTWARQPSNIFPENSAIKKYNTYAGRNFGDNIKDYYWFAKAFTENSNLSQEARALPLRRKVEIFIDCLLEFAELKTYWPINDRSWQTETGREGLPGNQVIFRKSPDRIRLSDRDMDERTEKVHNILRFASLSGEYPNNFWAAGKAPWWRWKTNGHHELGGYGTPKYVETDFAQKNVLDYYISRVFVPSVIPRQIITENRNAPGVLNQPTINTNYDVSDQYIVSRRQRIVDHLEENLQIGYRLMFGHKVKREEQTGFGATKTNTIKPSQIYGDLFPVVEENQTLRFDPMNSGLGLASNRNVFTKKRCFLGHVDPEPVYSGDSLNESSIFYKNALKITKAHISKVPDETSFNMAPVTTEIMNNLVYSIPIDEISKPIDCFSDLLRKRTGKNTINTLSPRDAVTDNFFENIENFFNRGLFEEYEDSLLEDLLSMEVKPKREDQDEASYVKCWKIKDTKKQENNTPEEIMKPHRLMFDFLFPLDRYAAMHLMQNVLIFDSQAQTQELLTATKLFIVQNIVLMNDIVASTGFNLPKNAMATMNDNMGGGEPGIGDIWKMIWKQLAKMIPQAAFAAIRQVAETADPGYKDMKEQYMEDPCSMKSGLRPGLLGVPMRSGFSPKYKGNKLNNGFGIRKGQACKTYVPATMFPLDIIFSIALSPWPPFINFFKTAKNMITPAKHFINLFPLPGVPVPLDKSERYGQFMGPPGLLALSVGELTGEEHARLKRENGCEDQSCPEEKPEEPPEEPMGMCEDLE